MNKMKIEDILKEAFENSFEILKKVQAGLRCKTFIVKKNNTKFIFQLYTENTIYQAQKKYKVLKTLNIREIPKAYKYFECNEYSYLITEYKEGINLSELHNDEKIDFVYKDLAKVLVNIHNIKYNKFGWITDKCVIENNSFIDYIKEEYNRLKVNLELIDYDIKIRIQEKVKKVIEEINIESQEIKESVLCWYDINPDNILVKEDKLTAVLDPGGARYGVPEWDLSFIKMEVCRNKEEFDKFLNYYRMYSNYDVNLKLLNALTVIVELDDMAVRILDKINLPIPYDSNFKEEIKLLEM